MIDNGVFNDLSSKGKKTFLIQFREHGFSPMGFSMNGSGVANCGKVFHKLSEEASDVKNRGDYDRTLEALVIRSAQVQRIYTGKKMERVLAYSKRVASKLGG